MVLMVKISLFLQILAKIPEFLQLTARMYRRNRKMNLSLREDHPVKVAANAAVIAADEAIRAARAFSALIDFESGGKEQKISSSSTSTSTTPRGSSTRNKGIFSSTPPFVPGATLAPRLYQTSTINHAATKLRKKALDQSKGTTPNVRWCAITDAVLELHPRFDALPDPTKIIFRSFADLTKFRQSSWQSEELHKCRVTTRHLLHALGLSSSPRLSQKMSISKKSIGMQPFTRVHQHLAGQRPTSYGYLCTTTMITRDVVLRSMPPGDDVIPNTARWTFDAEQQAHPNKAAFPDYSVLTCRAEPLLGIQICYGKPVVGERLILYANDVTTQVKYWKLEPVVGGDDDVFYLVGMGRSNCFRAGISSSNIEQGVHDGARVVMLEDQEEEEEEEEMSNNMSSNKNVTWRYDVTAGTLQHVTSGLFLCVDMTVSSSDIHPPVWMPSSSSSVSDMETKGLTSWTHLLRPNLSEEITKSQDRTVPSSFRSAKDVAMTWGGVQEATAVLALMNEFPNGRCQEVGCALLESTPERIPSNWNIDIGDLPLIGASPDAVLVREDGTREVVEIKNVCPWGDSSTHRGGKGRGGGPGGGGGRGGRGGGGGRSFELGSNKTPAREVPPSHMPQIQMEMFCTDTMVNNYVSMSAFHGVHIFRVQRDDAYIKLMLELLRNFELEIIRKISPGTMRDASFFENDPRYERLRMLSIQLSAKTKLWRQVFPTRVQRSESNNVWINTN